MIGLPDAAATGVVVGVIGGAAAWGAYLSIRSAEHGPAWARPHLARAGRGALVLAVAGVMVTALVEPVWMGLGITYVAVVIWWLGRAVAASLRRAAELGLDEPLPPARRREVLGRAGKGLLLAAGAAALLAALDLSIRGLAAVADSLLVAALAVPGWIARRKSLEGSRSGP